jgi:hypothetical protein
VVFVAVVAVFAVVFDFLPEGAAFQVSQIIHLYREQASTDLNLRVIGVPKVFGYCCLSSGCVT